VKNVVQIGHTVWSLWGCLLHAGDKHDTTDACPSRTNGF